MRASRSPTSSPRLRTSCQRWKSSGAASGRCAWRSHPKRAEEQFMADIKALAQRVDDAAKNATEIPQLAESITLEDAYAIQKESLARRYARGEKQVGIKMGFTSRDKMVQMGVHDMIWGRLTDAMIVEDGGATSFRRYVHPRIEPEIAFLLK